MIEPRNKHDLTMGSTSERQAIELLDAVSDILGVYKRTTTVIIPKSANIEKLSRAIKKFGPYYDIRLTDVEGGALHFTYDA